MSKIIVCLVLIELVSLSLQFPLNSGRFNDYKNHTCKRDCSESGMPMVCEYDFVFESYVAMSRACFDCPLKSSDCLREHCVSADGFKRTIQVANRLMPGPSIEVCKGDTIVVNVENRLDNDETTSIHWHGMRQKNTNFMDGTPMITQCPIFKNNRMKYELLAADPGTHLWRSHSALQSIDGLHGAIIVRQQRENEPHSKLYDYDLSEHVIIVLDWAHDASAAWNAHYRHTDGWIFERSILINGKGKLDNPLFVYPNGTDKSQIQTPLAKFQVKANKRYRFRLIDVGAYYCPKKFSIEGHNLTLISIDGNPIEPIELESIVTQPGERYDFVLNTKSTAQNYYIYSAGLDDYCKDLKAYQIAELNYENALNMLSVAESSYEKADRKGKILNSIRNYEPSSSNVLVADLRSIATDNSKEILKDVGRKVDKQLFLTVQMRRIDSPEFHPSDLYSYSTVNKFDFLLSYWLPSYNNIAFHMPSSPLLYQMNEETRSYLCNETNVKKFCVNNSTENYCSCTQMYEVGLNDLVEVILFNPDPVKNDHPIHLHGHTFALLGMDKIPVDMSEDQLKEMDRKGLLKRNFDRPPLMDSFAIPSPGYAIIRFRADNPGYWLLRCNIVLHSENGMAMVLKVGDESQFPKQPKSWSKCNNN